MIFVRDLRALIALSFSLIALAPVATAQDALPPFPVQLEEMMITGNGADFIDPASVGREGNIATVRVLAITPREVSATAYFWSLERIDCTARTIEKLAEVHFTESYVEFHRRAVAPIEVPSFAQANIRIDRVCGGPADPMKTKTYADMGAVLFPTWPRIDERYRQATGEEPR